MAANTTETTWETSEAAKKARKAAQIQKRQNKMAALRQPQSNQLVGTVTRFCVYDLETTGLSRAKDRIIELC